MKSTVFILGTQLLMPVAIQLMHGSKFLVPLPKAKELELVRPLLEPRLDNSLRYVYSRNIMT
jgi:hypothetical protein